MKITKNTEDILELAFVPWKNTLASIIAFVLFFTLTIWNFSKGEIEVAWTVSVIGIVVTGTLFFLVRPVDVIFDRVGNRVSVAQRTFVFKKVGYEIDLERVIEAQVETISNWRKTSVSRVVLNATDTQRLLPLSEHYFLETEAIRASANINEWLSK